MATFKVYGAPTDAIVGDSRVLFNGNLSVEMCPYSGAGVMLVSFFDEKDRYWFKALFTPQEAREMAGQLENCAVAVESGANTVIRGNHE